MKRALILLSVLALALGACSSDDPGSTTATGGNGATARVEISNFAFAPETLTVAVGTTVVWENTSGSSHTSTSDDETWDSGTLSGGDEFSVPFDEPGTFTYFCSIHSSMKGSVVVEG